MGSGDLGNLSMRDLFRMEVEGQAAILTAGLTALEHNPADHDQLEPLARAAHSIRGAARMVDVDVAVRIAHVLEDCFNAAQEGKMLLEAPHVQLLGKGVAMLSQIAGLADEESGNWFGENAAAIEDLISAVANIIAGAAAQSKPAPELPKPAAPHKPAAPANLADASMLELFRTEVDNHAAALTNGLLALENAPASGECLEAMMRAAHSIKGAARMVGVQVGVQVAHVMEDCFVAAQEAKISFSPEHIDVLLKGVDTLKAIGEATNDDLDAWAAAQQADIEALIAALNAVLSGTELPAGTPSQAPAIPAEPSAAPDKSAVAAAGNHAGDNAIRVSADNLNRLMGLAGESLVESRRLRPFVDSLLVMKRRQVELISLLDTLQDVLEQESVNDLAAGLLNETRHKAADFRQLVSDRIAEMEEFDRNSNNLSGRLNREVVASRMRPFSDGVQGFQRMVRDISRSLGKKIKLEIHGLSTKVDRDILERIEAPLNHLLRNAIDHGIEMPEQRERLGKPAEGTIRLEAMHSSGMLSIIVQDDGRGVDLDKLRKKIVNRNLVSFDMAASLSDVELLEFLFLPNFSTRDNVTEVSGRGVGLDVVQSVVQDMRGVIHTSSKPGQGIRFHLQLPLTLSVIRALLVEIAGEPYAFPLARIERTLKLPKQSIEQLEGRQYFTLNNQHLGIVSAHQVLNLGDVPPQDDELAVVVIGERLNRYGVVVDRFLGERSLVVQVLDPRLGKINDISSGAILDDGAPTLIIDVDDMVRSTDLLVSGGRLAGVKQAAGQAKAQSSKRILVVDDSITVREVERNMLAAKGYEVEVAVDGMDGWNAVRTGSYDLVISDIDMPRMNGFEFVGMIKQDKQLKALPVMIVSYKDREEDRMRGLEAGADYYLTKGSFHDETLLDAVEDLIGKA